MPRYSILSLTLATLSMTAVATLAQAPDPAGQNNLQTMQAQPAPVVRMDGTNGTMRPAMPQQTRLAAGQVLATGTQVQSFEPTPGVFLRVAPNSSVRAISLGGERTEFRVERGLLNLSVHRPEKDELVLIDLPGGQVQALKNGFYTFNAQTNTTRTLRGESEVVPPTAGTKAVKVKEQQALTFAAVAAGPVKARDFAPFQAQADVIPNPATYARNSDRGGYGYGYDPGAGFYGDGFYPYYAYSYPYGYGGWGYPGVGFGLGFGYGGFGGFGGYYGGGFRHFR